VIGTTIEIATAARGASATDRKEAYGPKKEHS
jgi:hypothetical protein